MGICLTKIGPPSKIMQFISTLWSQKPKALIKPKLCAVHFQNNGKGFRSFSKEDTPLTINPCDDNQLQKHNEQERQTG